jgi:hypothetical protein
MTMPDTAKTNPGVASGPVEETGTPRSKNERDFLRIASISTALAFGTVLGSMASLRKDASAFSFQFSGETLVAFGIGAAVGFLYWKLISLSSTLKTSLLLRVATVLLLLGSVGVFLYPLRFLSAEKLAEVWQGLGADAVVLSVLGVILWRIKRFLDRDSARAGIAAKKPSTNQRRSPPPDSPG